MLGHTRLVATADSAACQRSQRQYLLRCTKGGLKALDDVCVFVGRVPDVVIAGHVPQPQTRVSDVEDAAEAVKFLAELRVGSVQAPIKQVPGDHDIMDLGRQVKDTPG